jgi:hypothetical protein
MGAHPDFNEAMEMAWSTRERGGEQGTAQPRHKHFQKRPAGRHDGSRFPTSTAIALYMLATKKRRSL